MSDAPPPGHDAALAPPPSGALASLDAWMARNPWHPRIVPMVVYVAMLLPLQLLTGGPAWLLWAYPLLYTLQCGIVVWLLWRYRSLIPELNGRFHWGAVPVGVGVLVAWVGLGLVMVKLFPAWFAPELLDEGPDAGQQQHYFLTMRQVSIGLYWTSLILRLLGMSIIVPLFEELFVRSLLLRSFHRPRRVALGFLQLLADMPMIGEWFETTRLGQRVIHRDLTSGGEGVFGKEFDTTPLGALSLCGVATSTAIFALHHAIRDWPGAIACGIAYCLLVGWTNHWGRDQQSAVSGQRSDDQPHPIPHSALSIPHSPVRGRGQENFRGGLGPVIWAHGITNALLWVYCVYTWDWQFV